MTANDIRTQYGNLLSGEQVRQILHISKRKCTWILEHGYIPCSDSGGKTRRFAVRADDLLTNDDAAELTGYAVTTVDNHIRAGRLKAVHTQDGLRIPKAWLVEFMCGHGYVIRLKSQRQCEMLGRYFAGGE